MYNKVLNLRRSKIRILLIIIGFALSLFLLSILKTIFSSRYMPSYNKTLHNRAFRGAIISADNYTISNSEKVYQAVVRGASIHPDKKELFIKLFSIYSAIPEKEIRKTFIDKKGHQKKNNIILSRTITTNTAMHLKSLALKLRRLGVFRSIKTSSGLSLLYGLDIIEIGEHRRFPLHDVMSPLLGYVKKDNSEKNYIRPKGIKGIEGHYNKYISAKKDGYFKGKRDVLGAVIHDKNSIKVKRINGMDLHLNIALDVQRRVELMLDTMKKSIDAEQIMVGVMESKTGKVLTLASTERYDPDYIRQKDVPALDPKFSEYPYEAGSVLKPLTLAIALNHKVVTPKTWFKTGYKNFDITGGRHVNDDDFFPSLTATDIIVHSSNIGISQISWRLSGKQFREGLLKFGLAHKSGLDLSRDLPGFVKKVHLLNHKMHRANSAFGYGMTVTFAQLFKAYSAFNNQGTAMTPRVVNYLSDPQGKHYVLNPTVGDLKAVSATAAKGIHNILLEVVKRGTGKKAQYVGLEIGGKTGTAHIVKHGHYVREYHSSFYGFANDKKGHKYTIGVLVIRAKKPFKYFASLSAVPTFRNIVDILVNQEYLIPDPNAVRKYEEALAKKNAKHKNTLPKVWHAKKKNKPIKTKRSKRSKQRSLKSLFEFNKRPVRQKPAKVKPVKKTISKPIKYRPTHDSVEDLF